MTLTLVDPDIFSTFGARELYLLSFKKSGSQLILELEASDGKRFQALFHGVDHYKRISEERFESELPAENGCFFWIKPATLKRTLAIDAQNELKQVRLYTYEEVIEALVSDVSVEPLN